jgi:hypothetical protein
LLGITHNKTLTRQQIRDIADGLQLNELEILDSTHSVDCLFCERKYQCEDPRNQATFHDSMKDIDNVIKRIEDYPDLQARMRLMEEGQRIKEAIAKFGALPASYLFLIGKK